MRHGKKNNHLSRTSSHRSAMLSNMASSLILNKRISTTVAKAKVLRKYVEPLLTKSKVDDTNSRRVVFSYLQDKKSVSELFNNISEKISSRPGGYTRILKTGNRLGDNAEMCIIELVDYNDLIQNSSLKKDKVKTRRSRRSGSANKSKTAQNTTSSTITDAQIIEEDEPSKEKDIENTSQDDDSIKKTNNK